MQYFFYVIYLFALTQSEVSGFIKQYSYSRGGLVHSPFIKNSDLNFLRRDSFGLLNAVNIENYKPDLRMSSFNSFENEVIIEAPTMNSRRITSSIVIDSGIEDVWSILTDYDNLSSHVPNLTKSYLVPVKSSPSTIRLFQEGSQKIIGFNFRASVIMDMDEIIEGPFRQRKIDFKLVESMMFSSFDGYWQLRCHSRNRYYDQETKSYKFNYKTILTYSVYVRPKGIVPVVALEWRIREDVPTNINAVKIAAESLSRQNMKNKVAAFITTDGVLGNSNDGWGLDETLAVYIKNTSLD